MGILKINGDTEDSDSNYSDDYEDNDDEEVNFASTDFDDGEPILSNININDNYTWTILVWKSFTDDDGALFFTKEFANTHIRLMLNMDWFQPFVNSQYSVSVIYAVFCNLPHNERFKPHNILTLAVMPGPKEPSQHEINNYLYPIVNQLNRL
ncbi:hypothetical protein RclHR1_41230001 [Rhizophagus clarus]|uniref:Uncharacterized protein n=1 Tax=Rhizophagus clarus TaxID=94130 RepID=A0A2Z6RJL5_9GLOM|nr:hypothetical protein RclHR1_41230001 [Rhizophagus clarus]